MSTATAILPSRATRRSHGVATLFTATVTVTLAVTGIGLFEGHVVYPSWYDLAPFEGFAEYHAAFGLRLLPWLPIPLAVATVLTALMLRWRPAAVPIAAIAVVLALQIGVGVITGVFAIPLQRALGTAGRSPDEIVALLDQLTALSWFRDVPGVAVALAFVWMLGRQLLWQPAASPISASR